MRRAADLCPALVCLFLAPACLVISQSEASSSSSAEVRIEGGGPGSCLAGDGAAGGDGAWVIVRSGEVHSERYVEALTAAAAAGAGAGGAPGRQSDPALAPAEPGAAGAPGGLQVSPLDCEHDDEPVDEAWARPMNVVLPGAPCGIAIDAPEGSLVRYGVPGLPDVLPASGVVVVEELRVGAGATLAVEGDLTIYARRVVLESGSAVRSFAGASFAVLERSSAEAYEQEPGRAGGWLTVVAEEAEIGGALVTAGNPGASGTAGGDAGRLAVLANALKGVAGGVHAFPAGSLDASGGAGGDGDDACVR